MDAAAIEHLLVYLGIPAYSRGLHKIALATILYNEGVTDIDKIYKYIGFLTHSTASDSMQEIHDAFIWAYTCSVCPTSVTYYLGTTHTDTLSAISLLSYRLRGHAFPTHCASKYPLIKRGVVISHHIG